MKMKNSDIPDISVLSVRSDFFLPELKTLMMADGMAHVF